MHNNPYIGPRPFERSERDKFFGRMRETRDLLSLIMAERVVLFYAQSGAGKTSLLSTQIIPALEGEDFKVLPVARVGSNLPREVDARSVKNIFVFSALLALAGEAAHPQDLLSQTFTDFLRQSADGEFPPIVIFDQFEEILTTHRERWQEARGFMEQLRDALRVVPKLGAVLAMREDYVAGLDPYAVLLPRRLKARFRMELLGYDGALEAVKKPAQNAGFGFGTGVAERLVDDLRRIQRATDQSLPDEVYGPYIEPVQLQVVCSRLWDNLPERDERIITWHDVEQFGNIDRALTDFYESALQHTTQATGVGERTLRRWFSKQLITPMQTRGLVMRGEHETSDLPNEAIDVLDQQHIIRSEARAGAHWYELAHDRLVDPILASNAAWEQAHMTPLRIAAKAWKDSQSRHQLFTGRALVEAQHWAAAHPDEVEDYEREFLSASEQAQRTKRRNRVIGLSAVAALVVSSLVLCVLTAYAFNEKQRANQQTRLAQVRQLATQAQQSLEKSPQRSVLLALEALNASSQDPQSAGQIAEQALRDVLSTVGGRGVTTLNYDARAAAFSPDGRWLATGGDDVQIFDRRNLSATPISLTGNTDEITALAFSPDGRLAASGFFSGTVSIWDSANWSAPPTVLRTQGPEADHNPQVGTIAISPNGRLLAAGMADGQVRLWDMHSLSAPPLILRAGESFTAPIRSLAFSPNAPLLAVGSDDRTIRMWDINHPDAPVQSWESGSPEPDVYSLSFSPDGRQLAAALNQDVLIWDVANGPTLPMTVSVPGKSFTAVTFSPDNHSLLAGGLDGQIYVWDRSELGSGSRPPRILSGHEDGIYDLATSADGQWLASASRDKSVRLWNLARASDTATPHAILQASNDTLSDDGHWLITAGDDAALRAWDLTAADPTANPIVLRNASLGAGAITTSTQMSDDRHWLAALADGTLTIWDFTQPAASPMVLRAPSGDIASFYLTHNGRWAIAQDQNQALFLWDLSNRSRTPITPGAAGQAVAAWNVSSDGHWLVTYGPDHHFQLWDLTAADPQAKPIALQNASETGSLDLDSAYNLDFSPDGHWLLGQMLESSGQAPALWLWDLQQKQPGTAMPLAFNLEERAFSHVFSPDSRWLAAITEYRNAYLWDLKAANPASSPVGLVASKAMNATFSPNGRWLAVGGSDKVTSLWETDQFASGPRTLLGQNSAVTQLLFSPDSKWLATGGVAGGSNASYLLPEHYEDPTVLLWNLEQPASSPLNIHSQARSLTPDGFSPDGHWLVTDNEDGVQLWQVQMNELISKACEAAGRNLTPDEWQQYLPDQAYRKTCEQWPLENSGQ